MNEHRAVAVHAEWCRLIAEQRGADQLIAHFREHVGAHYERHNREGELSMAVWMVGVLNFMHIFEHLFPNLTHADLLYKLCRHHKSTPGGPEPPFDMEAFLAAYDGPIKRFHRA
ncbi:MAG: hypothetical protein KGI78_02125 [Patescibacteria group bacterium]|nr:hypothetical protein [Patescibacteria group bacterium]MDE1944289.1 hypothetical protein [Patescibacteria group bacterium]MDE1945126.1 hypothetical protein [Patescibacteria group bacterium]MDE2057630.1 hypothetical protein [Patescibacteria group bacterium]